MKNHMLAVLFIGIILLTGCSSNEELIRNLNYKKQSLKYLHDSTINPEKKNAIILLDTVIVSKKAINKECKVTNVKSLVIPLLFVNYWNYKYQCEIGKSIINENISNYYKKDFLYESERSGIFLTDLPSEDSINVFKLKVTIDTLNCTGPYEDAGGVFVTPYSYSYFYNSVAGPALAKTVMHFNLLKNNKIVLSNEITATSNSEFLNIKKDKNQSKLQLDYATAMVDALSSSMKISIEKMIESINEYLCENEPNLYVVKTIDPKQISTQNSSNEINSGDNNTNPILVFGYNRFFLKNGRFIDGKLCEIRKKEIIVERETTLLKISLDLLDRIENENQKDITKKELSRKDLPRVNYNKYLEFKNVVE